MKFRVVKDGICGGNYSMSIDDACQEIFYFKGWPSLESLKTSIQSWAKTAKRGSIFKTPGSIIIATK